MRRIISSLIVMLALSLIMPVLSQVPIDYLSPAYNFTTTSSVAQFMNASWTPNPVEPPIEYAGWQNKNRTLMNTTPLIYGVLANDWTPSSVVPLNETAGWPNKYGELQVTGYAIYEFMKDSWTPSSPVPVVETEAPYKKHQMS